MLKSNFIIKTQVLVYQFPLGEGGRGIDNILLKELIQIQIIKF